MLIITLAKIMPFTPVDSALHGYCSSGHTRLRQAAVRSAVIRSNVSDRNKRRLPWDEAFGHRQLFLPRDERALADNIRNQTLTGYPIDKPTLHRLANITFH